MYNLNLFTVHQKLAQHCKSTILQFKKKTEVTNLSFKETKKILYCFHSSIETNFIKSSMFLVYSKHCTNITTT